MNKSMKALFMASMLPVMMLMAAVTLTSCEGTLDDIFGEWSRPTNQQNNEPTEDEIEAAQIREAVAMLEEAQKEGSITTMYFTVSGTDYEATFKKVGTEFVLQELKSTKAATRAGDDLEAKLELIEVEDDGVDEDGVDDGDDEGDDDDEDKPETTIVDGDGTTWYYDDGTSEEDDDEAGTRVGNINRVGCTRAVSKIQVMSFTVTIKSTGEKLIDSSTNMSNSETTQECTGTVSTNVHYNIIVNGKTITLGSGNKQCRITLPNGKIVILKYKDKYDTWTQLLYNRRRLNLSIIKGFVLYDKKYWVLDEEMPVNAMSSVGDSYYSSTRVKKLHLYANVVKNKYKNDFRPGDKFRVRVEFDKKSEGAKIRDAFSISKSSELVSVSKVEGYLNVFDIENKQEPMNEKPKKFSVIFAYEDYNGTIRKATIKGIVVLNGEGGSNKDVESVMLSKTELELEAGETTNLTAAVKPDNASSAEVKWTSSDENVVTVSKSGEVTAVGGGTATITCTATNGTSDTADDKSATCAVTVTGPTVAEVNELYTNISSSSYDITKDLISNMLISGLVGDFLGSATTINETYAKALAKKICTEKSLTGVVLLMGGDDTNGYDFYYMSGSTKSKTHLASTAAIPDTWENLTLFYVKKSTSSE